jgi:hypothetical protein
MAAAFEKRRRMRKAQRGKSGEKTHPGRAAEEFGEIVAGEARFDRGSIDVPVET